MADWSYCQTPTLWFTASRLSRVPLNTVGCPSSRWRGACPLWGWGQHFCRARETVAGRPTLSPPPPHL
jgi:hypothetical protein